MMIALRMVMMMRDERPSVRFLLLMSIAIWVDHHLKRISKNKCFVKICCYVVNQMAKAPSLKVGRAL